MATKVISTKIFKGYNKIEKGLFEAFKEGLIAIMPIDKKTNPLNDEFIEFAEKFAITIIENLPFDFVEISEAIDGSGGTPAPSATTPGTTAKPPAAQTVKFKPGTFVMVYKDK